MADYVEVEGEVLSSLPNAIFKVRLDPPVSREINCHISGKIRKNFIHILPGDKVTVAVSTVDPSRGRIIFRTRKKN